MNTEVVRIDETSVMIGVDTAIEHHLFRDGGRVLTEILGYFPKGHTFVQRLLDVLAILQSKMFVVSRY